MLQRQRLSFRPPGREAPLSKPRACGRQVTVGVRPHFRRQRSADRSKQRFYGSK
jgi:hypothetical protein